MSDVKELNEKNLNDVSGGWEKGETFYTYCPFCYAKSQKHLIHSWWRDLECLKCKKHHRYISCNQAGDPDQDDLNNFYKEIGYVPVNPNQK